MRAVRIVVAVFVAVIILFVFATDFVGPRWNDGAVPKEIAP